MRTAAGTHADANSHSNSDPNCNAYFHADSNGYTDSYGNTKADTYTISLLKSYWGDAATAENDYCFDYLPRLTGDHGTYQTVMDMLDDENDASIVRSVIDLAHSLGLVVVAEGVEDEPTYDRLAAYGCDFVQGFHLGHPSVSAELTGRLSAQVPL